MKISVAPHLTVALKHNSFHVCAVLSYGGDKNMEEVNTLMSSDLGGFEKFSVSKTGGYGKRRVKPNVDELPI